MGAMAVSKIFPIPYQSFVYLLQISVSIVAFYYLLRHCFLILHNHRLERFWMQISIFFFTFNPLIFHFNMTLMTDGLCLSAVCFFFGGLLRFLKGIHPKCAFTVMFFSCLAAAQLRPEKLFILILTVALLVCCLSLHVCRQNAFQSQKEKKKEKRIKFSLVTSRFKCTSIAVMFLFCIITNNVINRMTHSGEDTSAINLSMQIFVRITHPHLTRAWHHLPEEIQAILSINDAMQFDTYRVNIRPVAQKLLEADGGGNRYLFQVARTVFTHYPGQVLYAVSRLFIELCFAPLISIHEYYTSSNTPQQWTYTRMNEQTPALTRIYWEVSMITLFLLFFALAFSARKLRRFLSNPFVMCMAILSLVNSLAFALNGYTLFHIRYALPNYVAFLAIGLYIVSEYFSARVRYLPFATTSVLPTHPHSSGE